MKKLLCLIGFHNWKLIGRGVLNYKAIRKGKSYSIVVPGSLFKCERCKITKGEPLN